MVARKIAFTLLVAASMACEESSESSFTVNDPADPVAVSFALHGSFTTPTRIPPPAESGAPNFEYTGTSTVVRVSYGDSFVLPFSLSSTGTGDGLSFLLEVVGSNEFGARDLDVDEEDEASPRLEYEFRRSTLDIGLGRFELDATFSSDVLRDLESRGSVLARRVVSPPVRVGIVVESPVGATEERGIPTAYVFGEASCHEDDPAEVNGFAYSTSYGRCFFVRADTRQRFDCGGCTDRAVSECAQSACTLP